MSAAAARGLWNTARRRYCSGIAEQRAETVPRPAAGHKIRFTGGAKFVDALEQLSNRFNVDLFFGGRVAGCILAAETEPPNSVANLE
jgi:hypothetical protein